MANRSLGTLTLDVVAQIGGYTAGLDKAEKEAKKRAAAIEKAFDGAFNLIAAGFASVGAAGVAALAAVNAQAETIANYQDLAEKIGDTAENITSLQQAATLSGTAMDTVAAASVKLTASLAKTDDESKAVGQAITALGLSFEEFKALSPVEQIDAVAKALAGFEDGAEKTAVAVALFGKAGAELLPFLNDLADQTSRQATLTAEQIKQTDDYTKAQARLKAEFDVFIQQQTAQLIPTLNSVQTVLGEIAKNETVVQTVTLALNTAIGAAITIFQTLTVVASDVIFVFQGVGREIGAIAAQLAALARADFSGFRAISNAVKEDGQRARAELDKFQKQVMSIGQPAFIDDETRRLMARSASAQAVRPRLNIGGLAGAGGGGGARRGGGGGRSSVDEAQRYLESLQKQLEKTQELTVQEQVLQDIQMGRLGNVSAAQKESLLNVAGQIDAAKEAQRMEKERAEAEKKALSERNALLKEGEALWESTRTPVEKYSMEMDHLQVLLNEGAISLDVYERGVKKVGEAFEKATKPVKDAKDEMDEFAKNAAENIQREFGDTLVNIMEGNFKDIGKGFKQMLDRMVAEALAAQLARAMFGDSVKGGTGSGWFGEALKTFGSFFGGARASGGPVLPNTLYQVNERGPEVFQAANGKQFMLSGDSGTVLASGSGGQVVNFNLTGQMDQRTQTQVSQRMRQAQMNSSVRFRA